MAYIIQSEKEKEQEGQGGQVDTQGQAIGGAQAPLLSTEGQSVGKGAPTQSGQFNNFQKYVDANKGGNTPNIAGGVQQIGDKARQGFSAIETGVNDEVSRNQVKEEDKNTAAGFFKGKFKPIPYANTQQNYTPTREDYDSKPITDKDTVKEAWRTNKDQLKGYINTGYDGSSDYTEAQQKYYNDLDTDTQKYGEQSRLLKTESGQRQLLDNYFGANRGAGVKDLDFSLVRKNQEQQDLARQEAQRAEEFLNSLGTKRTDLNTKLTDTQLQRQAFQEYAKNILGEGANFLDSDLADSVNRFEGQENFRESVAKDRNYNPLLNARLETETRLTNEENDLKNNYNNYLVSNGLSDTTDSRNAFLSGQDAYQKIVDDRGNVLTSDNDQRLGFEDRFYNQFGRYNRGQQANKGNVDLDTASIFNEMAAELGLGEIAVANEKVKKGNYGYDSTAMKDKLGALVTDLQKTWTTPAQESWGALGSSFEGGANNPYGYFNLINEGSYMPDVANPIPAGQNDWGATGPGHADAYAAWEAYLKGKLKEIGVREDGFGGRNLRLPYNPFTGTGGE